MNAALLIVRIVHIFCGVMWAGTAIFTATILFPAIGDVGPDGMKLVGALQRRRFFEIFPALAGLTILSGLFLYSRASGGAFAAYGRSATGMTIGFGALCAIIAMVIGVTVMRPTVEKIGALARSLAAEGGAGGGPGGGGGGGGAANVDRATAQATIQRLRERSTFAGRIVAALLVVTIICMATARYL